MFERNQGYEDQYIIVPSLREFLGDKFKKMSWPQFVDMIIDNSLDQHSELGIITITNYIYAELKWKILFFLFFPLKYSWTEVIVILL